VYSCTHWLRPCNSPPPPAFGLIYTRPLLVSQDRRHLFVTPWQALWTNHSCCCQLRRDRTQAVLWKCLRWDYHLSTCLNPHCTENPISVFLVMKLRVLVPNSNTHVYVSDLYIPGIGLPVWLQQNKQTDPGNINITHR
jgi:hypothetical protein